MHVTTAASNVLLAGWVAKMAEVGCRRKDSAMSDQPCQFPNTTFSGVMSGNEAEGVPLNTSWTFWIDRTERGASAAEYEACLKKVYTVHTVESFWGVYNNIPKIREVGPRYNYHLMRNERRPMWEDKENCRGGTWRLKCHKSDTDDVWKELLLAAIGEQFSDDVAEGDDVCGISVNVREKDDVVQIWNVDSSLAAKAKVLDKVHKLLPKVQFYGEFYKAHYTHMAYEGQKK